nr:hypothetical protein [Streptomyces sp. MH191]
MFFLKGFTRLSVTFFMNLANTGARPPATPPKAPLTPTSFQSIERGRCPSGASVIIASRTASVVNASSTASVRLGNRWVRWESSYSVSRMNTRLRARARAAWVALAPPVKKDSRARTASSTASRTSSAMMFHFASLICMETFTCPDSTRSRSSSKASR